LLVFSAPDQGGLASRFIEVARMLEDKGARIRLEDLAWTLAGTAEVVAGCRFARVSDSLEGLAGELRDLADCAERGELGRRNGEGVFFGDGGNGTTGRVAAVFPGLGFPGLVGEFPRHLLANCLYFPCVREVFDHLERRDGHPEDAIPTGFLLVPPAHLPQEVRARLQGRFAPVLTALGGMATSSQVAPDERNLSQMGMLANNHASWCVLQGLGIPVDMLCGQSLGDFSAVLAAGMVDFEESIPRFWEVFNLDIPYSDSGLIAMVGTTEDSLSPFLEAWPAVSIGSHLSPTTLVVGGPEEDVRGFCGQLREKEILAQTLPFPAIHTPQLGKAEQLLARAVGKKYRLKKSKITIYSGALAAPMPSNPKAVEDLFRKNLSRPVRFWQTVHRMYEDGARFVVQIGSGTLAAASQSVLDKDDAVFTAMDVSHRDPLTQLQHMCGEFFAAGVGIERAGLFAGRAPRDVLANEPDGDGSARSSTVPLTLYWPPMYHYERPEEVRAPVSPQPGSRPESVGVFPFVDLITDHQPGVSIGVASKITLAEHLYLADHTFSNANGLKPLRECFPVLPLTMTLELMAEVGACLAPGRGLVAFEDIRAHRWIAFEEVDTVNLHSEGEVLEEDDDRVVVRVSVSREGETVAQGRVIFSDHYRETLKLGFSDLSHPRPFPMDAAEVYDTKFLFHGPRFHCLSTIGMRGDQGILGELTVLDRNRLFASGEDPQLLTDPVTLDGPGQLVGIFFERNETRVLPVGVDRIEFYRPPPAPGTKVPVRVEFSEFDLEARRTSAFVEVQDGQGGVWFRMEGWRDLVFSWSLAVLRNMGEPGKYTLAEAHAFAGLPEDAVGVHLRHETIREVRLDWLARNYLTSREWERFRSMDNVFQRQRDWLMGRVAAKDAVRLWMSRRTGSGEFAHPAAIELENDASGKVSVLALAGFPKRPCISLSHGKAGAVAVASAHSVGIDAEPNEAAEALAKEDFTTPGELRRLNRIGVPPDAETSWLTRLWCAKEATAKFLGTGLEGRPRGFETVEVSSEGDLTVMHNESGRQVKVSISGFEGIVVAVATEPDLFVADGLPRYLEK